MSSKKVQHRNAINKDIDNMSNVIQTQYKRFHSIYSSYVFSNLSQIQERV